MRASAAPSSGLEIPWHPARAWARRLDPGRATPCTSRFAAARARSIRDPGSGSRALSRDLGRWRDAPARQLHGERRARLGKTRRLDRPAVSLHDLPRDEEAEAEPAVMPERHRAFEPLEDP